TTAARRGCASIPASTVAMSRRVAYRSPMTARFDRPKTPSTALEPGEATEPRPWPRHGSRVGADYRIFRSRWDELENPRTGRRMERVVLETPSWVNVIAVTEDTGEIVIVKQHRFGTSSTTIEIPGGMIDPGEDPLVAAKRELREETGYVAESWTSLGAVAPNPAFLDNLCHHFLATGARRDEAQDLDAGEDIVVTTMSTADCVAAIRSGAITHALVVTAMARVLDLREGDAAASLARAEERPDETSGEES
ncbi:MAG: NUDIX hydrolase, partial [Planctomycetota bacterium]